MKKKKTIKDPDQVTPKKETTPEPPKPKGYKACPQCGSEQVEHREDLVHSIRLYMCLKCNRNWEVPHRIIDHDLPYEPK